MSIFIFLLIIPMILGIWAQYKVMHTYNHWLKIPSRNGITGAEAASAVMRSAGINNVEVVEIPGTMSDHYDPTNKRLALSSANYRGSSLAALGVAAHEAGHAIQDKEGYAPLRARMMLIPITSFASQLLPFIILGGFFFHFFGLIKLGVWVYLILTVFQLITLPVEFDASRRASKQLVTLGIVDKDEQVGVIETLNAAGYTYVAAFISSLANLIYFFLLSRDR